jgi:hypothetical protein
MSGRRCGCSASDCFDQFIQAMKRGRFMVVTLMVSSPMRSESDQICGFFSDHSSKNHQHAKPNIGFAALDTSQVGTCQTGLCSEGALGHSNYGPSCH